MVMILLAAVVPAVLATCSGAQASPAKTSFVPIPAHPRIFLPQRLRRSRDACPRFAPAILQRQSGRYFANSMPTSSCSFSQVGGPFWTASFGTIRAARPNFSLEYDGRDDFNDSSVSSSRHADEEHAQEGNFSTKPTGAADRGLRLQPEVRADLASESRRSGIGDGDGDDSKGRMRSTRCREEELGRRSFPTTFLPLDGPAHSEEYDWRQSAFEFKSVNDPESNLARSAHRSREPTPSPWSSDPTPAAETRIVNDVRAAPPTTDAFTLPANDENLEWLRFNVQKASQLTQVVDDNVKELKRPRVITSELATQLGLPASASYDEIRTAFRSEMRTCHPDTARQEGNASRARTLTDRFIRLKTAWDNFSAAHRDASSFVNGASPNWASTSYRDEGNDEARRQDVRTRFVVHEDPDEIQSSRSEKAAAAVTWNTRREYESRPTDETRYMSDREECLDSGGSSC